MRSSWSWFWSAFAMIGFVVGSLHAATPTGFVLAQADGVTVDHAWARASAGTATTGAAYVKVKAGVQPDQIVGASTPVAATAEVHQTSTEKA